MGVRWATVRARTPFSHTPNRRPMFAHARVFATTVAPRARAARKVNTTARGAASDNWFPGACDAACDERRCAERAMMIDDDD